VIRDLSGLLKSPQEATDAMEQNPSLASLPVLREGASKNNVAPQQ
jgi:hypothetical protein